MLTNMSIVAVVLLLLSSNARAAAPPTNTSAEAVSSRTPLKVESFIEIPSFLFLLSVDGGAASTAYSSRRVQYNPTFGPNLGIRASFSPISLTWTTKLRPGESYTRKYGETAFSDIRMSATHKNWAGDIFYQRYDGFHADLNAKDGLSVQSGPDASFANHASIGDTYTGSSKEQIIKRPDISSKHYGAIAYHAMPVYPDQTTARAFDFAFHSGDVPDLAIDLIFNGYLNHLSIGGSSALVPEERQERFGEGAQARALNMNALGASTGLAFVMGFSKPMYMNALVMLGGGLQHRTVELADNQFSGVGFLQNMNSRIGLGARGETQSFDVNIIFDVWRSSVKNVRLDSSSIGLVLTYGVKI